MLWRGKPWRLLRLAEVGKVEICIAYQMLLELTDSCRKSSTFNSEPHDTRPRLINALQMLRNKCDSNPPRKHGNVPL